MDRIKKTTGLSFRVLGPVRPKTPTVLCGQQPRNRSFKTKDSQGPEKKGFLRADNLGQ
jgi:hypothetical protein